MILHAVTHADDYEEFHGYTISIFTEIRGTSPTVDTHGDTFGNFIEWKNLFLYPSFAPTLSSMSCNFLSPTRKGKNGLIFPMCTSLIQRIVGSKKKSQREKV